MSSHLVTHVPPLAGARWDIDRPPDFVIGGADNPYLLRWHLTPRGETGGVYLHLILRSDDDRALHDHPWDFTSLILHGRYTEIALDGGGNERAARHEAGTVLYRQAEYRHRLMIAPGETCTTLVTVGPRRRNWGFWCDHGWVAWQDFTRPEAPGEVGSGCLAPAREPGTWPETP